MLMLIRLRSLPRSLFMLLVLALVVLTAALATPAFAVVDKYYCSPPWGEREIVTGKTVNIIQRCEPHMVGTTVRVWRWTFLRFKLADRDRRVLASRLSSSPPYWMEIQGLFGGAQGGGSAAGGILITQPNGGNLDRRIAARTITEVSPNPTGGFYNCRDTGWVEASIQRSWTAAYINHYGSPDCGAGYYRAQVAGRFWSVSLNRWITSQWHYTAAIWISLPVAPTEPIITPGPHVENPEDP
jgi:hypothetical protein